MHERAGLARALPFIFVAAALLTAPVQAGHESNYYPSFYPQEIRVQAVDPVTGSTLLRKEAVQALAGSDATGGDAKVNRAKFLASFVLASAAKWCWNMGQWPPASTREQLAAKFRGVTMHPYPVTPYHGDFLYHADSAADTGLYMLGVHPAERPREVPLDVLLRGHAAPSSLWLPPPWIKAGWFHAYLLARRQSLEPPALRDREALYRRLATGAYGSAGERRDLERRLASFAMSNCPHVIGYRLRSDAYSVDYTSGIENVGFDSQTGLNSATFIRTAKLKEFPWNGTLRLGVAAAPATAWNPITGFTDPFGRLVWSALADQALLPAPYDDGWVPNRVSWTEGTDRGLLTRLRQWLGLATQPGVAVHPEAVLPNGQGAWIRVGRGRRAALKVVYTVHVSNFHDGTPMTVADAVYPMVLAYRWGTRSNGQVEGDPAVAAATAILREHLAGLRIAGSRQEVRNLGDTTLGWRQPIVEVYLKHPLPRDYAPAIAPPWSPVPWHVLTLMEEAAQRGLGALSREEAARRGIPWIDLVRDRAMTARLAALAAEFERSRYRPPTMRDLVSPDEAAARWHTLRLFYKRHGHLLIANGPYSLARWSSGEASLKVFRDMTYPLTIGTFDRFAIPRRAFVDAEKRGTVVGGGVTVERVMKFARSFQLVREPLKTESPATVDRPSVRCRYVVIGDPELPKPYVTAMARRLVLRTGTLDPDAGGTCQLDVKDMPGQYVTVLLAAYANENAVNVAIKEVRLRLR